MLDVFAIDKIAKKKDWYEIRYDMRIESKNARVVSLVEPVPMKMLMGAACVKVCGKLYKFYYEFDNPYGFGMDDGPELPESLVGQMVEIIDGQDPRARAWKKGGGAG